MGAMQLLGKHVVVDDERWWWWSWYSLTLGAMQAPEFSACVGPTHLDSDQFARQHHPCAWIWALSSSSLRVVLSVE